MLIAFKSEFLKQVLARPSQLGCLDYSFTHPLVHFYMSNPQDWIALTSFEDTVLVVGQRADRLKRNVVETSRKREQGKKLYPNRREGAAKWLH